ncbi:MAG: RsmB/NOP family class I SAM-dependent RNA methyltransferase [Brachymonas sp.]
MHPKDLLDHCTALTALLLHFEHPAETVAGRYFREQRALGPRERATVAETVYAILRRKPLFEWLARSGSGATERRLAILGFAGARPVLQATLSLEEQQWLAACDQARADALPEALTHNLPPWLAEALQVQLGPRFDAAAAALLQAAPLDLRVNTLHTKRNAVLATLQQEGLAATATPYSPWGIRLVDKPNISRLELFRNGHIEVQDEGSQLLALLLDARRGEMVADFCAGAGGKTLALGAAMRNTGRLYALDTSAHRLEQLKPRLARSGLENVYPMAIADERDERLQRLAGKIDRVLVDAPCSGLGTLRRQPDLKWRQTPDQVRAFAERQKTILHHAARLLKPGGRLVYATCSLLPAENEAVALDFSAAHATLFKPLNTAQLLREFKVPDAEQLCTPAANSFGVPAGQFLRLWPDLHGTDGFFGAVWQKTG